MEDQIKKPEPLEGEYLALRREAEQDQGETDNAQAQAEPEIKTAELIFPICQFVTAIFCPNWKISDKENEMLADGYAAVLDKYFPDSGKLLGVELNALLITAAIFGPRIAEGKPARVKEKEVNPDKEKGGQSAES